MLKTILSISGKPGLYKLVSHGKNMLIVELRAYFAEVLPSYDRERVYPSDIKKLLSWYNILINAGITDFTPEDAPAEKEAAEKEAE